MSVVLVSPDDFQGGFRVTTTGASSMTSGGFIQQTQQVGLQPTAHFWHGERFVEDASMPEGDFRWDAASVSWSASGATIQALGQMPPDVRIGKIRELVRAREGGQHMVQGVVRNNVRRGAPTREPRADLSSLVDRAKALVVTIAELDQPTDGQITEITKTVADLQGQRDAVMKQLEELDSHLSIGRAVILAHSDPRAAGG